MKYKTEW